MTTFKEGECLLATTEAAAYCGCHPNTIRSAVRLRELACYRRGKLGKMRFSKTQLEDWLRTQERASVEIPA